MKYTYMWVIAVQTAIWTIVRVVDAVILLKFGDEN